MNEQQPIVFGVHDHLVGIVTRPESRNAATGVVMLTAGMLPSQGPYRLHQRLAETFAADSIPSLRFDLSGIGESLGVGGSGPSLDRAGEETSAAISELIRLTDCNSMVLFGLCSGADDAIATALADDRVTGLVLIDGCGYRTWKYHVHRLIDHYIYRGLKLSTWRRRIRALRIGEASARSMPMGIDVREFADRDGMTADMQRLIDRGVRMHFIYTGGVASYYNHSDQVWQMMPAIDWKGSSTTRFFADMDHTAMLCEDREMLIDDIRDAVLGMLAKAKPDESLMPTSSRVGMVVETFAGIPVDPTSSGATTLTL